MGIQQVTLDGGLDLVNSKQVAPPGTLRDCLNFEVGIKRGYVETKGLKAYAADIVNDVIDPWVIHWFPSAVSPPNGGYIVGGVTGIGWTDRTVLYWGGDPSIGKLNSSNYSGKGVICYSHQDLFGGLGLIGFTSIEGRLPVVGDILQDRDVPSLLVSPSTYGFKSVTMIRPLYRASDVIRTGATVLFNSTADTVDAISDLINQFDITDVSSGLVRKPDDSPLATKKGLFHFNARDTLYLVSDIERRSFASEDVEYSVGDRIRLYYTGSEFITRFVSAVTVTSGGWTGGDAAGFVDLTNEFVVGLEGTLRAAPTQVFNVTKGVFIGGNMGAPVTARKAGLFRAIKTGWIPQDLGSEVRFVSGEAFPSVLNRVTNSAQLELATSTTGWLPATIGSGWSFASNATGVPDGTVATQTNQPGTYPAFVASGFGFALPARSVVLGIEVRIRRRIEPVAGNMQCRDRTVTLVGTSSQNKAASSIWPTTLTDIVYGSGSDAWGTSLSTDIVNSDEFGVSIVAEQIHGGVSSNREIDSVEIQITYKDQSSIVYFGGPSAVTLSSLTSEGAVATGTTATPHGLAVGDSATIAGASPTAYNGTFTVATVPSPTTFTYAFAGGTSPATGTKTFYQNFAEGRVIWYHKKTGDWGTGDAEGTLTVYGLTGNVPSGVTIRTGPGGTGTVVAVTASTDEKVYLPASQDLEANNSQWEFAEGNFFGSEGTEQVFGVSGAGFAWSWDGTYLIRIRTGVEDAQDKPAHVMKHLDQLLLGYRSGSVIASDAGYPESFAAIVGGTNGASSPISDDVATYPVFAGGAQEIPMGDAVYGLTSMSEQAAFVGCKDSRRQIVGTVGALIQTVLDPSIGIIEYTLKNLSRPIFTDYEGVKWVDGELLSYLVSPWLIPRIQENKAKTINSSGVLRAEIIRYKSQYRLFFMDKMILTITLNRGGIAQNTGNQCTFQSLPFAPAATTTGVTTGGSELIFAVPQGVAVGGNDLVPLYEADPLIVPDPNLYPPAFVYQMDVGSTWDGVMAMPRFIETNSATDEGEWRTKTYDRMIVSGTCYGFAPFGVNFGVNFGDIETSTPKNINAGKTSDPGIKAFSEQYFSVSEQIKRDGYALALKFVANGDNLYGATSAQTSPFKFRPLTLQSVLLISESNAIRR